MRPRLADPAEADDPQCRAAGVVAEKVGMGPAAAPTALANGAVTYNGPPSHREQKRERQIGGRGREYAWGIRDGDAAHGAGADIDQVVAGAVVRNDSEVREQVERLVFDRFAYDCERLDVLAPAARAFREHTGQVFDVAQLVPGRPGEATRGEDLQGAAILSPLRGGGSSVGRAPGCGPGGRGFESRPPPSPERARPSRFRLAARPHSSCAATYRTESISLSAGFQIAAFAPRLVF